MKVLAVLVGLLAASVAEEQMRYDGFHVIQVGPVNENTFRVIDQYKAIHEEHQNVLIFHDNPKRTDILVAPFLLKNFTNAIRSTGAKITILDTNVQKRIDLEAAENEKARREEFLLYKGELPRAAPERYLNYAEIAKWMDNLAKAQPFAKSISIGKTYEGRSIKLLRITKNPGKPKIFIDCGIHSREWISISTCIWIMGKLVNEYGVNSESTRMVNNFDWYFAPVLNPDGYEYSHVTSRMWRKTRRPIPGHRCVGTDANRNWSYKWQGSSWGQCSDTWPGEKPFSEPCTKLASEYITREKNNMILYINAHSYTQLIFPPYGYEHGAKPPDYEELKRVAFVARDAVKASYGRTFTVGTPWEILYAAKGTSLDWAKGNARIKYSYALEMRPASYWDGGFILPPVPHIRESGEEWFNALAAITKEFKV